MYDITANPVEKMWYELRSNTLLSKLVGWHIDVYDDSQWIHMIFR